MIQRLVVVLAIVLLLPCGAISADPASCASFGDPRCFFAETWDNGLPLCTDVGGLWACNADMFANAKLVSPGLNGSSRAARLTYANVDSALLNDIPVSHTSAQGEVVFIEWSVRFSPNYTWAVGAPGQTDHLKFFEWQYSPAGAAQQRMLLILTGNSTSGTDVRTTAQAVWSIYPNTIGGCGSCGDGNGETFSQNIAPSFRINPSSGLTYHFVTAVTLRSGTSGRLRMWINNTLVMDHQAVQTAGSSGSIPWNFIRMTGQYARPTSGSYIDFDQVRITTTDLTPGTLPASAPAAPFGLTVNPAAGS